VPLEVVLAIVQLFHFLLLLLPFLLLEVHSYLEGHSNLADQIVVRNGVVVPAFNHELGVSQIRGVFAKLVHRYFERVPAHVQFSD